MTVMFKFLQRRRYKQQVLKYLHALLCLYPRGPNKIEKDYPGVLSAIDSHFVDQMSPQRSAVFLAASVLTNAVKALAAGECLMIRHQLPQLKVEQLLEVTAGKSPKFPDDIAFGTIMFGVSILIAKTLVDKREIEQTDYDLFSSEIRGALEGKTADQRSSERVSTILDKLIPLPKLDGSGGPDILRT